MKTETLESVICLMERRLRELHAEEMSPSVEDGRTASQGPEAAAGRRAAVLSFYREAMEAAQSDLQLMQS